MSRRGVEEGSLRSSSGVDHRAIAIPEGSSEAQLWDIFQCLTAHVPEGCKLYLDITHGFRSLPVLGFIALSYLRVTRRVEIGGIFYGAWEARDLTLNIAPVFNLTPFLILLDWTAAADSFLTTGSAARLGKLLTEAQQTLWRTHGNMDQAKLPRALKNLGKAMTDASLNLLLLRTSQFSAASGNMREVLKQSRKEAGVYAKPFFEIIKPVEADLTRFPDTDLATLRSLVAWLAERGQVSAALTLAAEWLTSWVMVQLGCSEHHIGESVRRPYQECLTMLLQKRFTADSDAAPSSAGAYLEKLIRITPPAQLETLVLLANRIRQGRNDLNHAGFREHPQTASGLVQLVSFIAQDLANLPLPGKDPRS